MRRFLLVFLGISLAGCVTGGGRKTKSGWSVLQKAENARCAAWPKRSQDLQTNELNVIAGSKKGLIANGLKRDASPQHVYAPFNDDPQIDQEDLLTLNVGRAGIVIGGATFGGRPAAVVVQNVAENKAVLEVRTVTDNVIKFKGDLATVNVIEGAVRPSKGGLWIAFKSEDNEYRVAFLDQRKPTAPVLKAVPGIKLNDRPEIVASPLRPGAVVAWKAGETGRPFKAEQVSEDVGQGNAVSLDIDVKDPVESWAAVHHAGSYFFAVVEGDSLVGQAALKISQVNWSDGSATVKSLKAVEIRDTHVSDPVFLVSSKGLEVLLLNWVDEESTIARYMVAGGMVGKPSYSGIFPKGTRVAHAFTGQDAGERYVITRHKDDNQWSFNICEL